MNLKKTPLNEIHRNLGARMVEFGGWEMPVQYPAGTIEEHLRTRIFAGLFDVSHMGEFLVEGEDSIDFVNFLTTNDVRKLKNGQAQYSILTNENGGVVDDLLVYRFNEKKLMLVVNAATTEKDWQWINLHKSKFHVKVTDVSKNFCQIAIQGPKAQEILQQLTENELSQIKYYHFVEGKILGFDAIISRTGYTGEDGFEVYADAEKADKIWMKLLDAGDYGIEKGILPCGLAARNTLRLEAAMSLYGNELSETITPLEANLAWVCKLEKGEFIGREALLKQKNQGLQRRLVGFEMIDKAIARDGFDIYAEEKKVGKVTSGAPAPFLKKNIGLAFVLIEFAKIGQEIKIDVRGKRCKATIVPTPFYKRSY
ncbi:MAG: glycine cleavage system aminomethyltransferase GcvT [Pyrinomonadaceae bacterium]|nr:glycine cleavage system aminomethyltransferase GcvT [Pyrinomonadaceae bacterium]MCX7640158.1 glycine cleavage system aminomethyltransferase GcvT [Pyrinomonadaceae bacterium]MDW8303254.1 glycine cleavage system aminomethyltransferase GcvT [Acidobacteriota bacterium]